MKKKLLTTIIVLLALSPVLLYAAKPPDSKDESLEILVDALVVCPPNSPTRFVDNGDGTICDSQTGLMWEIKNARDGIEDFSNPRDVDNHYTWTSPDDGDSTNRDGTVFTEFLAKLNGELASTEASEQLGGYNDWRLPTSAELQTLAATNFPTGGIDPIFGPYGEDFHWSYTSYTPNDAFGVTFSHGLVYPGAKLGARYVRAVRGTMGGRL